MKYSNYIIISLALPICLPKEKTHWHCLLKDVERTTAPLTQQVRQSVGPVRRAIAGAQDEIGSFSSRLCPGSCQLSVRSVGLSPREPHKRTLSPIACCLPSFGAKFPGVADKASTWSYCPSFNLKQTFQVGAWNIWSLWQDDCLPLLSRALKWELR